MEEKEKNIEKLNLITQRFTFSDFIVTFITKDKAKSNSNQLHVQTVHDWT